MSTGEFFEWMAYFEEEPFGEIRADYRNAMKMAQLANMFRDGGEPIQPDVFMPKFGQQANTGDEESGPSLDEIRTFFGNS